MDIKPIISTLRRHKTTAWLLIVEIALTCAILSNAVFLISQRMSRMDMPSGVAERQLLQIQLAAIGPAPDRYVRAKEDLAALRQIAGVQSVALTNQVPFGMSSSNANIRMHMDQQQSTLNASEYFGEDIAHTFGLRLLRGRLLEPDDFVDADTALKALKVNDMRNLPRVVVITRALAQRLWPGKDALGRTFYITDRLGVRVVGIVDRLIRANPYDSRTAQYSMILPVHMGSGKDQSYVIRTLPQERQHVLKAAVAALEKIDPHRVIMVKRTFEDVRQAYFQGDRAMTGILVGICLAMMVFTAFGIVGLASLWVAQRRRTIGVRRALGATRMDILRYFQTENFLLATAGIALGVVLTWGVNLFLMWHYELPRLPWAYLPVGAIALWLIGQLSVLGPALRAAAVPPVVATRSV